MTKEGDYYGVEVWRIVIVLKRLVENVEHFT